MKSIAFVPAHGGTGQTTIVMEVAKAIARKGKLVLIVGPGWSKSECAVLDRYLQGQSELFGTFTLICDGVLYTYWNCKPVSLDSHDLARVTDVTELLNYYKSQVMSLNKELLSIVDVVLWDFKTPYYGFPAMVLGQCDCCFLTAADNRFKIDYFLQFVDNLLRLQSKNNRKINLGVLLSGIDPEAEICDDCKSLYNLERSFIVRNIRYAEDIFGLCSRSNIVNSRFWADIDCLADRLLSE